MLGLGMEEMWGLPSEEDDVEALGEVDGVGDPLLHARVGGCG